MRGEWSPEVGRGESKHPSLPLARAERKPLDRKKNIPRATSAKSHLKKKSALLQQRFNPRHQREIQLKENQALLQRQSALRRRRIRPLDENISRRKINSP